MTGTLISAHMQRLREKFGTDHVDAIVNRLEPSARDELNDVSPLVWVRIESVESLYETLANDLGRDVAGLHWEIGRECAERTFRTLWRLLLRVTSDAALVARAQLIYTKTFTRGRLTARVPAPGRGEVELTGWPDAPVFVRRSLCIGLSTILTLAGRRNVSVQDERSRDGASFTVSWD
jgi:hypothetical protein